MNYDYNVFVPEFSLRNGRLVFLASEVAVDIENHILDRTKYLDDKSVKYLSQLLNSITQGENPIALFPENHFVLNYAISGRENVKEYWEGKTNYDVLLQINLVAKELRDFKTLPQERQKSLVDFCINLSNEAISYYDQYYGRTRRLAV